MNTVNADPLPTRLDETQAALPSGERRNHRHIVLPNTAATLRQSAIIFTNAAGVSDW